MNYLKLLVILALIMCVQVKPIHAQGWFEFEVDSIVTINFPSDKAFETDTMMGRVNMHQLRVDLNGAAYILQKSKIEADSEVESTVLLPYDLVSLNHYYDGVINGFKKKLKYGFIEASNTTVDELVGRHVLFSKADSTNFLAVQMYVVNDYLYQAFYLPDSVFDHRNKDYFLRSLRIKPDSEVTQYNKDAYRFRLLFAIAEYGAYLLLVVLCGWVFLKLIKVSRN